MRDALQRRLEADRFRVDRPYFTPMPGSTIPPTEMYLYPGQPQLFETTLRRTTTHLRQGATAHQSYLDLRDVDELDLRVNDILALRAGRSLVDRLLRRRIGRSELVRVAHLRLDHVGVQRAWGGSRPRAWPKGATIELIGPAAPPFGVMAVPG